MKNEVITMSAKGQKLGRLACAIAMNLMGKNEPTFRRNTIPTTKVVVTDAKTLDASPTRLKGLHHRRYSGYPGGLTIQDGIAVVENKGMSEVIIHAVSGMLPKNKLRDRMLKNLTVQE